MEGDDEAMRFLRHEAGHALNYAFRVHERAGFLEVFGDYARPYADHYPANPLSRSHVRHILGWYAQKHPDEDFAETFAVWLTPGSDWRAEYDGWGALAKLEWMDALMRELAPRAHPAMAPGEDDVPVEAMHWTVADHYAQDEAMPLGDARQFDGDLRRIFAAGSNAPDGESADRFLSRHEGELTSRISYWSGAGPAVARSLLSALATRAAMLDLRVSGLEAGTLIELTAFGMAVVMHWRYTSAVDDRAESEAR